MPYREDLDAALARAAAAEGDLEEARSESAHDHERIAELERALADAQHRLKTVRASEPSEAPKPHVEAPKKPASKSERKRHELLEHVDRASTTLEKHKSEPVSLFGNMVRSVSGWFLFALLGATVFFHIWGFPAMGTSPAALACPMQCSGCRPSARVFSWNYRGSWREEKGREGYALVCANPRVDIRALTEEQVRGSKNRQLQPYMVSGITVFFLEALALAPIIFVVFGSIYGVRRRRKIVAERRELEDALHEAEARLAAFDAAR